MSTFQENIQFAPQVLGSDLAQEKPNWYAVHTMARHEKRVAAQFEEKRVCTFLPLMRRINKWSDRKAVVEVPMFSCYAFVRMVQSAHERLKVLRTPGVLGFVGNERQGSAIPEEEIESLRKVIDRNAPLFPHPFISAGTRVRIRGGVLDGVEGIFLRQGDHQSLLVSVALLSRSVSVRVEGYDVELL